jgi:hypothetical protein
MSPRLPSISILVGILAAGCGGNALSADGSVPVDRSLPVDSAAPLDSTAPPDLAAEPDLAGLRCGGLAGRPCPTGMFCETMPGQCCCDFEGLCQAIPAGGCPKNYQPVCGCDGKTYGNDCQRQMAGVSPDHAGACTFACGQSTCRFDQICFQGCCGAAGCMPPPPICMDAPAGCNGQPTCACIPNVPLQTCADNTGHVLLTQFGCP